MKPVAMTAVLVLTAMAAMTQGRAPRVAPPKGSILIEGERSAAGNFLVDMQDDLFTVEKNGGFVPRTFSALHGGGASMLCTKTEPDSFYYVSYEFVARSPAERVLWVYEQGRAWAAPFRWRIGNMPWQDAPVTIQMEARGNLEEGGPTFAWSQLGRVKLGAGKHRLDVRVEAPRAKDKQYLLSQDCFVLVDPALPFDGRPFQYRHEAPTSSSILLWDDTIPGLNVDVGFRPWMDAHLIETKKALGAVVICPGGAYVGRAPSEGANVAARFNEEGFHAFVVYYRTAPHHHPGPFMDASRAMRIVRSRAREWKVKPDKIALCGFSAGGHLSASVGVHFDKWAPKTGSPIDTVSCRPDALILCYPVISSGEFGHRGSFRNLLGDEPDSTLLDTLSLEKHVSAKTPPAFLWHTAPDKVVVENSLLFAQALSAQKVPFEIHVFHKGPHAMNLAEDDPHVATWVRLCVEWLDEMGWRD